MAKRKKSDPLRAEAERMLVGGGDSPQWQRQQAIARFYLEANPADDGDPVTEEWLVSLGGKEQKLGGKVSFFDERTILGTRRMLWIDVEPGDGSVSIGIVEDRKQMHWYLRNRTRGQIRTLLTALGAKSEAQLLADREKLKQAD